MLSKTDFNYNGVQLKPGDRFEAEERFVPVLEHLGRAITVKSKRVNGSPKKATR